MKISRTCPCLIGFAFTIALAMSAIAGDLWHEPKVTKQADKFCRVIWNRKDFLGDASVSMPTPPPGDWRVGVVIGASGCDIGGNVLTLDSKKGKQQMTLVCGSRTFGPVDCTVTPGAMITLTRAENKIIGSLDDKVLLSGQQIRSQGHALGVFAAGATIDTDFVHLTSDADNVTFWLPRTGNWEIGDTDGKMFIAGASNLLAQLWSRSLYEGNQTIEFTASNEPGARAGDIGLTFCGDGKNLDSGYQLLIGGWHNKWTRLLRNGKIVAGFQGVQQYRPIRVKIRKEADIIELFVDGNLVRRFVDTKPEAGGRVAFWTINSAIHLTNIRITAEKISTVEEQAPSYTPPPTSEEPHASTGKIVNDNFSTDAGRWAARDKSQGVMLELVKDGLQITNATCGGTFAVTMFDKPFDLLKFPVIEVKYRQVSDEPVCLNLFARVNDELYELPLTAPVSHTAIVLPAGQRPDFTGSGERTFAVNLGQLLSDWLLKNLNQKPATLNVTELYLANASNANYLQCGFGGNRAGAKFIVREFSIKNE